MMERRGPYKVLCWLCVGLALSTCTHEVCLARGSEEDTPADSSGHFDLSVEHTGTLDPLLVDTPSDSLGSVERNVQPLYKKWWVWALVTTAVAVTAVVIGGGQAKETEENLPGFPDPPSH
jgi:hypothetical protein